MGKNYKFLIGGLLAVLIGISPILSSSQGTEEEPAKKTRAEKKKDFSKYLYVNANIGLNMNHTDVAQNKFAPPTDTWRLGYGAYFGWQFSPIWGVRGQLTNGNLYGEKANDDFLKPYESVYYKASVLDYHLDLTINFNNLFAGYHDRMVNVYGIVGFGQSQWKTESYDKATDEELRLNGTGDNYIGPGGAGEKDGLGGRTLVFNVPAGLGVSFRVSPKFDITFESILKTVDSDRLDTWTKGAMAVKQDMYSYTSLGLTYKFKQSDPLKQMAKEYETVTYKVEPDPLESIGGKVPIKVTGTFPEGYFDSKAAMFFDPALKCGDKTIPLKSVVLKGEDVGGEGILIPESGGTFTIYDTLDYEPCMKESQLIVSPVAFIPKEDMPAGLTRATVESDYKNVVLPERKLADGVINTPARIMSSEKPLIAAHGYEKEMIISKDAKIYFEVNKNNLNWNVPLNKLDANKKKLEDLNNFISLGYKIREINVDGWASPEGEETFNNNLSENRAKNSQEYLFEKISKLIKDKNTKLTIKDPKTDIKYNLAHHGPDWNGFLANVQGSDIKDKNIILNVINSAGTPAKKEQEIRNMVVIYPELEEKMLPQLRRAEIVINCFEPKKPDDEITRLAIANPRDLTEKELLYSATLTSDKDTRLQIYKSAINIFPNSYKGYLNAAVIEIEKGDMNTAKAHLEKAASLEPNNGQVQNNLGVVAAMQGDYAKAEGCFNKAKQLGENVDYNLGIVMINKGEYAKALNLFGNTTCDYNVALAQLLSKNYTAAEKTANCAPKNAQTYYLLAIIGARTNNTTNLFGNLTKAVQENPAYKEEAKIDREFIKYFADPNFTSIVK